MWNSWLVNKFELHRSIYMQFVFLIQFSSVAQSCPTLCDPVNRSMPDLPVHHQLPEFTQNSCPSSQRLHPVISSSAVPFSSYNDPSQHQGLFQWVNSSHEVAKVLEFQLQHQSFQWTPRSDLLQDGLVGSPCSPRTLKSLQWHHSSKASILLR